MRLASLVPIVSTELASSFEICGIRTDADILFRPTLEIYRQLPPGTITLHDLEKLVSRITELASASGTNGVDMLELETQSYNQTPRLLSGSGDLDHLIEGYGGHRIIEISGDKQSGKTTLALNVALRHLVETPSGTLVWIDTTGDFSVEKIVQILPLFQTQLEMPVLERIQICLAFDIETIYKLLEELRTASSIPTEANVSCIVIDSITPLIGPLLTATSAHGHTAMTSLMRELRNFAQNHYCSILIINNATLVNTGVSRSITRKPALGPSFTYLTDATLWLSKPNGDTTQEGTGVYAVRILEVLRSKSMPPTLPYIFKISQGKILGQ